VAEVASRFEDIRAFLNAMAQLGFRSVSKVCPPGCPVPGAGCAGDWGALRRIPWSLAARDCPSRSAGTARPSGGGERDWEGWWHGGIRGTWVPQGLWCWAPGGGLRGLWCGGLERGLRDLGPSGIVEWGSGGPGACWVSWCGGLGAHGGHEAGFQDGMWGLRARRGCGVGVWDVGLGTWGTRGTCGWGMGDSGHTGDVELGSWSTQGTWGWSLGWGVWSQAHGEVGLGLAWGDGVSGHAGDVEVGTWGT